MHILFLEPFLTPILFIFIGLVLLLGFLSIRSIYKKEDAFEKKREAEFADYDKVLSEAHIKAEYILEKAAQEASTMSGEGKEFTQAVNKQVEQAFKEVIDKNIAFLNSSSHEFLVSYQNSLQGLKSKYEHEIEGVIQKMQQDTLSDFAQLQSMIREKTIGSHDGFTKQLDDEFAKTQIEIHEYKKQKLQEITQRMDKIVMKVAEEVLGQSIPLTQQQQLITKALENAQKEGMFDT
ncbi:MAG TPA: hypothetical protein VLG12_06825 [Candidatus Saccharimonadales bacterium]|nr:hypothetical protein [Candidatus Saccharimonadales bacterium]